MKTLFSHIHLELILVCAACIIIMSSGCSAPKHEGFAIYLTRRDIRPNQMPALSQIAIAEQPIIGINDIITYNSQTHELKLSASSYEDIFKLNVPVEGKPFIACVDKNPSIGGLSGRQSLPFPLTVSPSGSHITWENRIL